MITTVSSTPCWKSILAEARRPVGALRALGLNPDEAGQIELVRGIPASDNFHTGYAGRTGIFELMMVENDVRRAILDGAPREKLHQIAVERGLQTLEQSARNRVLAGVTTVEEMHRVLL